MNRLRLRCGFTLQDYQDVTGLSADTLEPGLSLARQQGLLDCVQQRYFCSDQGWKFLDGLLANFLPSSC